MTTLEMTGDSIERDEDRLPWLETVDDGYDDRPSMLRLVLLIGVGLAVIAAAVAGLYWYQDRRVTGGSGELIAAPEGDYKVKPDQPGGMRVAGEGDAVFKTSEGSATKARVDLSAVPEAPVAGRAQPQAVPVAPPSGRRVEADVPPPSGRLSAAAPATATPPPAATGGGGAVVQLGSFPSDAVAQSSWKQLAGRFGYLAGLGQSIQAAEVNGRTVHRLRVNAGSNAQAREICGKLKIAGEACFVVS